MAAIKTQVCIIGTTLEALCAAQVLSQHGLEVLLIEKSDRIGGSFHPTTTEMGKLSKGFAFWPNSGRSDLALRFVERALGFDLGRTETTLSPLTFAKAQLQTFVGFGESAPEFVDEISPYLKDSRYSVDRSTSSLIGELSEKLASKIIFSSSAVSYKVEDQKVASVELEDGRSIEAEYFFFSEDPRILLKALPTEEYTQRELQKIHRTPVWTGLLLDVIHDHKVSDEASLFMLTGQVKDSLPFIGGFDKSFEFASETLQSSHWLALLPQDIESEEVSADALREMKRQIKRVYPDAFNKVKFEKITLISGHFGHLPMKADAMGRWPDLGNFWFISSQFDSEPHHIGSLCQASLATEAILKVAGRITPTEMVTQSESGPALV